MHLIVRTDPNTIELNWMWLPTWLGLNTKLKEELEVFIRERFLHEIMTEQMLAVIDMTVIEFIVNKFPGVPWLREYLQTLPNMQQA